MYEGHRFKKQYGQNFLVDQNIINKIIASINPNGMDDIIEIGPGDGALTELLSKQCKSLTTIEIDKELASKLQSRYELSKNINILNQDVLATNFFEIYQDKFKIVGNLPYNISSPILVNCLQYISQIIFCIFMLQKEVVERICAKPSTSNYGRLSVVIQHLFEPTLLFYVSPNSFFPKPKVDSAILHLSPKSDARFANNIDDFNRLVKQAFSMRRKTIYNNLKSLLDISDFNAIGIDEKLRPENLSVEDYIKISNYISNKKGKK